MDTYGSLVGDSLVVHFKKYWIITTLFLSLIVLYQKSKLNKTD